MEKVARRRRRVLEKNGRSWSPAERESLCEWSASTDESCSRSPIIAFWTPRGPAAADRSLLRLIGLRTLGGGALAHLLERLDLPALARVR